MSPWHGKMYAELARCFLKRKEFEVTVSTQAQLSSAVLKCYTETVRTKPTGYNLVGLQKFE